MFKPGMRSSDRTVWGPRDKQASVPSLDYEKLLSKIGMEPNVTDAIEDDFINPTEITVQQPTQTTTQTTPTPTNPPSSTPPSTSPSSSGDSSSDNSDDSDLTASVVVKDLRTAAFTVDDITDKSGMDELDKGSIIPVPGLMVDNDMNDDDATTAPIVSDWIAPQGPFWNSYSEN